MKIKFHIRYIGRKEVKESVADNKDKQEKNMDIIERS